MWKNLDIFYIKIDFISLKLCFEYLEYVVFVYFYDVVGWNCVLGFVDYMILFLFI